MHSAPHRILTTLCLIAAAAFSAQPVRAAVIVAGYNFTGSSSAASTEAANVTADDFIIGSGISSTESGFYGSVGNPAAAVFVRADQTTEPVSPTSNDYIGFTVTPDSGYELDLTSLSFDYAFTDSAGDSGLNATFTLRSSIDGFAGNIASFNRVLTPQTGTPFLNTGAIDLSGASYQGLTDSITFRIYLTDNSSGNSRTLRVDNVVLSGDVSVIPEPAMFALLGLGACLLATWRKRSFQP
jgi:hypothetical protein